MIQVHRLEGFYWVARTGGYARAARAFPYPITQPAVHQQVKKLEADLGVTLFERVGKDRMIPTAAGKRLFDFIRPFYDRLPAVVRSVTHGEYGGELSIRTSGLLLRHLLPAWIKRLHRSFPEIRVHVEETHRGDLAPLRNGDTDLIVDHIPRPPDDVAVLQVATLRPFIVMPRAHRLARRKRISLSSMEGETFISYTPGMLPHQLQLQALSTHGVVPERLLSASSAEAILGLVEAGLGYSIVPSLDPEGPRGKGLAVVPLAAPRVDFPVYAAWRKDMPENPLLDAALETAPRG